MKKSMLFIAMCSLLYINKTQAQLKIRNSESNPLYVAVAYYVQTDEFEGWYATGWYYIEPNETKTLIGGNLAYKTYYFYARDTEGAEWKGGGKYSFVVEPYNEFKIKNADKEYQLKDERVIKSFKKIDVGEKTTYTLSLTEEED